MNWSEKLRLLADWIDLKHPDYASDDVQCDLRKLADIIAAGCLVPVPVGEPVLFDHIQRDQFVLMDGDVFVPDKLRCQMVRITDNQRVDVQQQFMDDAKFHVVRLERREGDT